MKTLPVEYRHRVIALTTDGYTTSEIAEVLGTSAAWVRSIKALHRSGRPLEPKSKANKRLSLARREGDRIRARVREKPGTTLEDLKRDLGLSTSISNLWNALQDLKISLKKSRSGPPSRTGPTSSPPGRSGPSPRPGSIPAGSSSSTRRSAPRP
jgi:transposase